MKTSLQCHVYQKHQVILPVVSEQHSAQGKSPYKPAGPAYWCQPARLECPKRGFRGLRRSFSHVVVHFKLSSSIITNYIDYIYLINISVFRLLFVFFPCCASQQASLRLKCSNMLERLEDFRATGSHEYWSPSPWRKGYLCFPGKTRRRLEAGIHGENWTHSTDCTPLMVFRSPALAV